MTRYDSTSPTDEAPRAHRIYPQYLVVTLGDAGESTHAISKTLNPEWNVTFDLPIVGLQSLLLEAVCWDKDRFGKDYLGEFALPLDEIFANGQTKQEVRTAIMAEDSLANIHSHDGTLSDRREAMQRRKGRRSRGKFKYSSHSRIPPILHLLTSFND